MKRTKEQLAKFFNVDVKDITDELLERAETEYPYPNNNRTIQGFIPAPYVVK